MRRASGQIRKLAERRLMEINQPNNDRIRRTTLDKQSSGFFVQEQLEKVENVNKLVDKGANRLRNNKIPMDVQFYQKNLKKFENLSSFIPAKGLFKSLANMRKITPQSVVGHSDDEQYADYLLKRNQKQRDMNMKKISKSQKNSFQDIYGQCWETQEAYGDPDEEFDINKQLNKLYAQQINKKQQDEIRRDHKRIKKVMNLQNIEDLTKVKQNLLNLHTEEVKEEDQIDIIKKQAIIFKEQSDKVIKMIQGAAKRIYNKKEDQIKKELIMHQVAKKIRDEERQAIRSRVEAVKATQSYTVTNQKVVTNKYETIDEQFYKKNLPDKIRIQSNYYVKPSQHIMITQPKTHEELKRPGYLHGKQTMTNRINGLIDQLETFKDQHSLSEINQMHNEELAYFTTLREALQPDTVKDTLKSLLSPNRKSNVKPVRYNKKQFLNRIL